MPTPHDSSSFGDSAYDGLLARFRGQPVGKKLLLLAKDPPPPSRHTPPPRNTAATPMPPALSQRAVSQLRAVWTGFMAGSPGFGMPRDGAAVDGLDCRETFLTWRDACRARALSPLMCVEIVCLGMSDGDARYRMISGTSAQQAALCLDIYCHQRGWQVD